MTVEQVTGTQHETVAAATTETAATTSTAPVAVPKAKQALTRIYVVEERTVSVNGEESVKSRLVRAGHPSQVYMHLAKTQYDVGAASADTVADLMTAGVKLEIAGE